MPEPSLTLASGSIPDTIAEDYLRRAEQAFATGEAEALETLFLPNGYLRE